MITRSRMRQRPEGRALRQLNVRRGQSAGRNSSGRITVFHRGGGSKRLQRRIDLKRSTSSMGIVERIEYDPNRSSRIALVRWVQLGRQRKCKTREECAPRPQILEASTTTIRGPFSFSSTAVYSTSVYVVSVSLSKKEKRKRTSFSPGPGLMASYVVVGEGRPTIMPPGQKPEGLGSRVSEGEHSTKKEATPSIPKRSTLRLALTLTSSIQGAGRKESWAKDVFFSALSSAKALSFGSSFAFPRIAVAGAKPAFFAPRMRDQRIGKKTFSLCEILKLRRHSILWPHRIKGQAALDWQSLRRQERVRRKGGRAAEHQESQALRLDRADQGSLPAKPIGERTKDGRCKVDRAPVV